MEGPQTSERQFRKESEAKDYAWRMMLNGFDCTVSRVTRPQADGIEIWIVWSTFR